MGIGDMIWIDKIVLNGIRIGEVIGDEIRTGEVIWDWIWIVEVIQDGGPGSVKSYRMDGHQDKYPDWRSHPGWGFWMRSRLAMSSGMGI